MNSNQECLSDKEKEFGWTLLESLRLVLLEDYTCPNCLSKLDKVRKCHNSYCNYDSEGEWINFNRE